MYITEYDIIKDKETQLLKLQNIQTIETNQEQFNNIEDIINIINSKFYFDMLDTEHYMVVALDNYNRIKGIYESGIGTDKQTNLDKRMIGIFLLLIGAKRFITFHNHPDNIAEASIEDELTVLTLHNIGELLSIEFNGSYIIYENGYTKIKDMLKNTEVS